MPVPTMRIDRSSPIPLYFQVTAQLEAAIDSGALSPGDRLPNEIDLAGSLGLSRPTMRRALEELVDKGLLVRKRGYGTEVANTRVHRRVELTSLYDDLDAAGQSPTTEVLKLDPARVNAAAAAAIGADASTPLVYVERLRLAEGRPLAVMHNWLPPTYADVSKEQLVGDGLYRILRSRGVQPQVAKQRITARSANQREARLLKIRRGQPLIAMQRTAYDADGQAIEFGDHVYRADGYAIEVTVFDR
ncbi:MAG TPA: GntR family transcriptional regulator [Jatrophihabitantaceae bacterium]|nr:GntR family transcriptional regulator [Jatrophihabitantaceae bacterium]